MKCTICVAKTKALISCAKSQLSCNLEHYYLKFLGVVECETTVEILECSFFKNRQSAFVSESRVFCSFSMHLCGTERHLVWYFRGHLEK